MRFYGGTSAARLIEALADHWPSTTGGHQTNSQGFWFAGWTEGLPGESSVLGKWCYPISLVSWLEPTITQTSFMSEVM